MGEEKGGEKSGRSAFQPRAEKEKNGQKKIPQVGRKKGLRGDGEKSLVVPLIKKKR